MKFSPPIPSCSNENFCFHVGDYSFGFQAQEKDGEMWGGSVTYKYRVEDPRLGRFFSVDPLYAKYPWNSNYAFSENRVIDGIELEGLEYLDADNANIGAISGNDGEGFSFKLGETEFKNVEKVEIKGKNYFVLGKEMYFKEGVWGEEGNESDLQTQLINTPATATVTSTVVSPNGSVGSYPLKTGEKYQVPTYLMLLTGRDPKGNKYQEEYEVLRFGVKQTSKEGPKVVGLSGEQDYTLSYDYITTMKEMAWRIYDGHFLHRGPNDPNNSGWGSIGCIEVCRGEWKAMNELIMLKTGQTSLENVSANKLFNISFEYCAKPPLIKR